MRVEVGKQGQMGIIFGGDMRKTLLYLLIGATGGIGIGLITITGSWIPGLLMVPGVLFIAWCLAGLWLLNHDWESFKRSKWNEFARGNKR